MNSLQTITYFLKEDSIEYMRIYFATMFFIIIITFLIHCCNTKKENFLEDDKDDISTSTPDEIVDNEIDTSEENYSSVFFNSLDLMTKKQLLRIIGVRFRNLNKDQIITIIMGKLIINAVENNIYITKESKNFIRENEKKMESEFFSLYNIKNTENDDFKKANDKTTESDTDAVIQTSDYDTDTSDDEFETETVVKTF